MPYRNRAERNRNVRGLLIDGGVAARHQLVAIVLECLTKIVELGPGLVTIGTTQVVLSGKSRNTKRRNRSTHNCQHITNQPRSTVVQKLICCSQMALVPKHTQQSRPV